MVRHSKGKHESFGLQEHEEKEAPNLKHVIDDSDFTFNVCLCPAEVNDEEGLQFYSIRCFDLIYFYFFF